MTGGGFSWFLSKRNAALRRLVEWRSRNMLRANHALWSALQEYIRASKSTGCGYIDYATLYSAIRQQRPLEVLECGSGVSTLVIAHALMENETETGKRGLVTSMDEHREWSEMAASLLPERYQPYVDFRVSETVQDTFSLFRGVRYRDVPERDYEFVFIDGPNYHSPVDGTPTFDFDFIHVLRRSRRPVGALIDKRVSTCFVLQQVLGHELVRYAPVRGLGFVAPCGAEALGKLSTELSSVNFGRSFRLGPATRLSMCTLNEQR
jgi:hypothetical protein